MGFRKNQDRTIGIKVYCQLLACLFGYPRFADKMLNFQLTDIDFSQEVKGMSNQKTSNTALIRNYNQFIFRIWPKLNYDAHREYAQLKENYEHWKFKYKTNIQLNQEKINREKQKIDEQQGLPKQLYKSKTKKLSDDELDKKTYELKQFVLTLKAQLEAMETQLKKEIRQNNFQLTNMMGKKVKYGKLVQLQHYISKEFIQATVEAAWIDKSAYKVSLSKTFNRGMLFKFLPKFRLRQEGQDIEFSDQLQIYSPLLKSYLNFSNLREIELDTKLEAQHIISKYGLNDVRTTNKTGSRYECNFSQYQETIFKIIIFASDDYEYPRDKFIKGGDLIRLQSTETNGYLSADNYYDQNAEVCVRMYEGEYPEENNCTDNLWEIEHVSNSLRGNLCELYKDNESSHQRVDKNRDVYRKYRLRHFRTGRVLSFIQKHGHSSTFKPILAQHPDDLYEGQHTEECSQVIFQSTQLKHEKNLKHNRCYMINLQKNKYLTVSNLKRQTEFNKTEHLKKYGRNNYMVEEKTEQTQKNSDEFFTPLEESDFDITWLQSNLVSHYSEKNAFIITKISEQEKENCFFVSTCVPYLSKLVEIFKLKREDLLTPYFLKKIVTILERLIFFVLDINQEETPKNAIEIESIPLPDRQRLVKDMKVIELLTDILYYPTCKNGLYDLQNLHENHEILKISQLSYRLIKHIIREFRPNEIYASQWIDMIMRHTLATTEKTDLKAEPTLTELIDNNKRILEARIQPDTIVNIIDMLKVKNKHAKYVNILRALVNCDDSAILGNQVLISRLILEDQKTSNSLLFKIKQDAGVIEYRSKLESRYNRWEDLANFQNECNKGLKNGYTLQHLEYFSSIFLLLSDLCLDRNMVAINFLEKEYTFDLCYEIISNGQLQTEYEDDGIDYGLTVRHAFTRLMITLWIDRQENTKIILPNKIRIWNKLEYAQMSTTAIDQTKYTRLKQFVLDYVQDITKENAKGLIYQKSFEEDQNELTKSVLDLLKNLLIFGFYQDPEELGSNNLLVGLLQLLNGCFDVTTTQEEVYLQRNTDFNDSMYPNSSLNYIDIPPHGKVYRLRSRYEQNVESIVSLQLAKSTITNILDFIYKLRNDFRVTKFLKLFKQNIQNESTIEKKVCEETMLQWLDFVVNKDDKISFRKLSQNDFVTSLLDLFLYKNEDMQNSVFLLLHKTFNQNSILMDSLLDTQIIIDKRIQDDFDMMVKWKNDVLKLAMTSEDWFPYCDGKVYSQQADDVIAIFDGLSQRCSTPNTEFYKRLEEISKDQDDEQDKMDILNLFGNTESCSNFEDEDFLLFKPEELINKDYQILFRNIYAYESAIAIIKYDIEESDDIEMSLKTKRVLCSVYKFLARITFGQEKTKFILQQHVNLFFKHLNDKRDIPAHFLIRELYQDNKFLLNDYHMIQKLVQKIAKALSISVESSYSRSHMLCSLKNLIYYQGQPIPKNQSIILDELANKTYENILIFINKPDHQSMLKLTLENYQEQIFNEVNIIQTPFFLSYIGSLLHLLACLTEGNNIATQSKCQSYFKLSQLNTFMNDSPNCWEFRKSIVLFFYYVFCTNQQELGNQDQREIDEIIEFILNDFHSICTNFAQQKRIKTQKGIYPLQDIKLDYLINGLCVALNTIIKSNLYKGLKRDKKSLSKIKSIDKIYEVLYEDIYRIAKSISNEYYKDVLRKFIRLLKEKDTALFDAWRKKIPNLIGTSSTQSVQHKPFHTTTTTTKDAEELIQKKNEDNVLELTELLQILQNSEECTASKQKEIYELVDTFAQIESMTMKEYSGQCTIYFEEIGMSLINFIDVSIGDQIGASEELQISGLQILRKLIERENKEPETYSSYQPSYAWEADAWDDFKLEVTKRQAQLCDLGIVNVIGNIISSNKGNITDAVKYETINLAIALLLGGNQKAQAKFSEFFTQDMNNSCLLTIQKIIEKLFRQVQSGMDKRNQVFFEKMMETEKFNKNAQTQDEDLDTDEDPELKEHYMKESIAAIEQLVKVFRLLQLFCEGHNETLQAYLRIQVQQGRISGKTFNFISQAAFLFGSYLKFVNVYSIDLGDQIIEFLVEALQGPCVENQLQLSRDKIVQIVKKFLELLPAEQDYKNRGFITEEQQTSIDSLMIKSISLLTVLIEANNSTKIMNLLCQYVDVKQMRFKLIQEYTFYITNVLELQSSSLPKDVYKKFKCRRKYGGNIEEAFNIYFLLVQLSQYNEGIREEIDIIKNPLPMNQLNNKKCLNEFGEEVPVKLAPEHLAREFYTKYTKSIEILFKDNIVYQVFFPLNPVCKHLSDNKRDKIMQQVDRESQNEKILGLINVTDNVFTEMRHISYLSSLRWRFTSKKTQHIDSFNTIVQVSINLIICFTYFRHVQQGILNPEETGLLYLTSTFEEDNYYETIGTITTLQVDDLWGFIDTKSAIYILGFFLFIGSCLRTIYFLFINCKLIIRESWTENTEANQAVIQMASEKAKYTHILKIKESDDILNLSREDKRKLMFVKGPYFKCFEKNEDELDFNDPILTFEYYYKCLLFIWQDGEDKFPELRVVSQSITTNIEIITATCLFFLFVIFTQSLFAFWFLDGPYYDGNIESGERSCPTVYQCFMYSINYVNRISLILLLMILKGVRNGGGIGDSLVPQSYNPNDTIDQRTRFYLLETYIDLQFVFITTIFNNLFAGIIIDKFAQMREFDTNIDNDKKNMCYICGFERHVIDKTEIGFQGHIDKQHCLWNYLYYIFRIQNIDETDYNGIESYVAKVLKDKQDETQWFPIKRALCLQDKDKKTVIEKSVVENLNCIHKMSTKLNIMIEEKVNEQRA